MLNWKKRIQDVLAKIPGTRQFRRRMRKLIVKDARESLQKFMTLEALDQNTRQNLRHQIRRHENRLAVVEEGFLQCSSRVFQVIVWGFWLVLLVLGPYAAASWFRLRPSFFEMVNSSISGFFLSMFVMGFSIQIFKRTDQVFLGNDQTDLSPLWIINSLIMSLIGFGVLLQVVISSRLIFTIRIYDFLIMMFVTAFAYIVVISILFAVFVMIAFIWTRYVFYRCPDFVIIDRLIRILSLVEKNPQRWGELQFKKELAFRLETIANCLAHHLPRQLKTEDALTDSWLADVALKSAVAIRGLKKWVITPKQDTRDQLIARLARNLTLTATGNWDGLEQTTPEVSAGTQKSWFHRLASLLGRLLSAFSLLILSWVLPYTPLALEQPLAGYLTLVGIGVAVFGITTMLDPSWVDKLNALKEFMGLLPFTGRNK